MSIEGVIHERWAADPQLAALLPGSRLFTGFAPGGTALPYAVLTGQGSKPRTHTSSGTRLDDVQMRIVIWSTSLDEAKQIAELVRDGFDRIAFVTAAADVRLLQCTDRREEFADDRWSVRLDFTAIYESTAHAL